MILTILGLLFVFAIPGFLVTMIFFEKSDKFEKTILSIILSISFYVLLGVFLGFNETAKNLTGGLSTFNLWIYSLVINIALLVIYIIKKRNKK